MDLIDRSEVQYKMLEILPEADSLEWYEQAKPEEIKALVDELYNIVLNVNRIDAQPVKRGKWIDSGVGGTVRCSNCKFTDFFAKRDRVMLFDFCPGCGSRMSDSAEEVVEYEAQWILRSDKPDEYNNMKYDCSRCGAGETFNINIDVPFCWKCGARMKKMHD